MVLVSTKRRGMGIVNTQIYADRTPSYMLARSPISSSQPRYGATSQDASGNVYTYGRNGWQITTSTSLPTTPGTSQTLAAQPYLGETYQDQAGNIYTYGSAGWQLTSAASSGTVPSTAAQSAAATPSGFPSNPTINQTYTDTSGNVWTYTSSGWVETTPEASASSAASWLTESSIAGIPNYWLVAGGGLLLILMMKGRR